jgi:hypothetical protein
MSYQFKVFDGSDLDWPTRPSLKYKHVKAKPIQKGKQNKNTFEGMFEPGWADRDVVKTVHKQILEFLAEQGDSGITVMEVCEALNLSPRSTYPRFTELCQMRKIEGNGNKRRTSMNKRATIYIRYVGVPWNRPNKVQKDLV